MRGFAAQRLLPAERADIDLRPVDILRESGGGCITDGEAGAVGRDPVAIGRAYAAGRAVPGEHHIVRRVDAGQIGDLAIIGSANFGIELQLPGDVGDPARAEALPGEHGHRPWAEQRPDRQLHRAGVGRRDDPQAVVSREPQQRMRARNRISQSRLAERAAMRAAERIGAKQARIPAGRLGAGAR